MSYGRTPEQRQADLVDSKAWEQDVARAIGPLIVDRTDSTTELDFWIPGAVLETKEKKQPLTERWHLLPGVPEPDLFILDELSYRKAAKHFPTAYFVIRDRPQDRVFVVSITELVCQERARVNRAGKGKHVYQTTHWTQIQSLEEIVGHVMADLISEPWKRSECIGKDVPQV